MPELLKILAFLAVAITTTTTRAGELPAPIAQATSGQMQCYQPNPATKSCQSLASYRAGANGTIDNTAIVMIAPKPLITIETVTPVEIKNGQVCGKTQAKDIAAAKLTVDGKPVEGPQADAMRQRIGAAFMPMFDHEICTAYVADGSGFIAKATDNGALMSAAPRVIWVSTGDGYKVGP